MDSQKLIKELISEALEQKGLNREKLAQTTGIPDRFLDIFLDGGSTNLPAAPYVRGYLKKIAGALDLDAEELWRMHEREFPARRSGETDMLPGNRFAIQSVNKVVIIMITVGILALAYMGINSDRLMGAPSLTINNPSAEALSVASPTITIDGFLGNPDDTLTINNETVYVDENGQFKKTFPLDEGLNNFDISAKRFLGKTVTVQRQVVYTPEPELRNTPLLPQVP
ncbi:MAG: helix-turn-helix domain-containing protein [bacterium]|nr:helix-turn-helix domain-containing protein [bacterium]